MAANLLHARGLSSSRTDARASDRSVPRRALASVLEVDSYGVDSDAALSRISTQLGITIRGVGPPIPRRQQGIAEPGGFMSAGTVLGLTGAGIVAISAVYYAVDVLRGGTRPQRTSWGVWALVGILGVVSSDSGGAGPGMYAAAVDAVACAATFLLSLASCRATASRVADVSIPTSASPPSPASCCGSSDRLPTPAGRSALSRAPRSPSGPRCATHGIARAWSRGCRGRQTSSATGSASPPSAPRQSPRSSTRSFWSSRPRP